MQLNLTINHTFEDPVSFAEFAAKFQAVFADMFKASPAIAKPVVVSGPAPQYRAIPAAPDNQAVCVSPALPGVMPVAGSFGGGNGGVVAPVEPSGGLAADHEAQQRLDPTANTVPPEASTEQVAPKRTRRTKAEMEAARQAPSAAGAFPAPAPAANNFFDVPSAKPAAPATSVPSSPFGATQATLDDVKASFSDLIMAEGGETKLADFMRSNGWKKTIDIPADRYNEAVTKLKGLLRA